MGRLIARVSPQMIPKRYRSVKPKGIAHALLEGVLQNVKGEHFIESEDLHF